MSQPSKKFFQSLAKARENFTKVKKDGVNPFFNNSKYITLDNLINCVAKPLQEEGLYFYHQVGISEANQEPYIKCVLTDGEEFLESSIPAVKCPDMQKLGGAITYARRYSLVALLGLVVDKDDDGNMASGVVVNERQSLQQGLAISDIADFKEWCQTHWTKLNQEEKLQAESHAAKLNKISGKT